MNKDLMNVCLALFIYHNWGLCSISTLIYLYLPKLVNTIFLQLYYLLFNYYKIECEKQEVNSIKNSLYEDRLNFLNDKLFKKLDYMTSNDILMQTKIDQ